MAATTNWTSLTANLLDLPNRAGDPDYVSQTPLFIANFEASANRKILSRFGEMTATLTTDADGLVSVPADFIALRNSNVLNGNLLTSLSVIPQGAVASTFPITTGGDPYYISFSGSQLSANPPAIRDITFDYYAKFVPLSVSNATNWVVTNHPDYYLYGAMKQASIYLRDAEGISLYDGLMQESEDEILALFSMEQFYMAGMLIQGATP